MAEAAKNLMKLVEAEAKNRMLEEANNNLLVQVQAAVKRAEKAEALLAFTASNEKKNAEQSTSRCERPKPKNSTAVAIGSMTDKLISLIFQHNGLLTADRHEDA